MPKRLLLLAFFLPGLFLLPKADAQWTQVGDTIGYPGYHILFSNAPDGTLYLMYTAPSTMGREYMVVRRLNGTAWETLPVSSITNGQSFPSLVFDSRSVPYIVTDTQYYGAGVARMLVLKFDGSDWNALGNTSQYFRIMAPTDKTALVFDSANTPYLGYNDKYGGTIIRYDGNNWEQIAGQGGGLRFSDMIVDPKGRVYCATRDTIVSQYSGGAWQALNCSGLDQVEEHLFSLSAPANGRLYLTSFGEYTRDRTIHEYRPDGTGWTQLGKASPDKVNIASVFSGIDSIAYKLQSVSGEDTLSLFRFIGTHWIQVAGMKGFSWKGASCSDGFIYVVGTDDPKSRILRVLKYDTRNDALAVNPAPATTPVSIAPNPVSKALEIRNTNPAWNGSSAIVTDIHGRTVEELRLEPKLRVETASWHSGIYQLRLPDGQSIKIVKN